MATQNNIINDTNIDNSDVVVSPVSLFNVIASELPALDNTDNDAYIFGYGEPEPVVESDGYDDAYLFGYGDADTPLTQTVSLSNVAPTRPELGKDWRVRISVNNIELLGDKNGILGPLIPTAGVVFPYNPEIGIAHVANYANTSLTHVNYQYPQYVNSDVQPISINATFTAQDSTEAAYVQAVLHFFKTWTKMFYGNSRYKGSPPPICYLSGYGEYQFNRHPILIQSFSYSYPSDVDYISVIPITSSFAEQFVVNRDVTGSMSASGKRLMNSGIQFGGGSNAPVWNNSNTKHNNSSRIPTKLTVELRCLPLVTRNTISNKWNFADYASGKLTSSGIW